MSCYNIPKAIFYLLKEDFRVFKVYVGFGVTGLECRIRRFRDRVQSAGCKLTALDVVSGVDSRQRRIVKFRPKP